MGSNELFLNLFSHDSRHPVVGVAMVCLVQLVLAFVGSFARVWVRPIARIAVTVYVVLRKPNRNRSG